MSHKTETLSSCKRRLAGIRGERDALRAAQATWTPTADSLPPVETPVIAFYRGECRILERRTETPSWEETYDVFDYWDDPTDDGQEIDDSDVTHWMPTPPDPQ